MVRLCTSIPVHKWLVSEWVASVAFDASKLTQDEENAT